MNNLKTHTQLGDHTIFDQNKRIQSFSGFAHPRDILTAWYNAVNPRDWYEKYKEIMFQDGIAIPFVGPRGIELSSYTPWSITQYNAINERGERKIQWKDLGREMLSDISANDCQGIFFGDEDPKAALISLPSSVTHSQKYMAAYKEDYMISTSSDKCFKQRRIVRLFPHHFLFQEPWDLNEDELAWLEKNQHRNIQLTLDLDGCREERLNFTDIFNRWSLAKNTANVRNSILKIMPYVQNEFKNTMLDERETRAALFLVNEWEKRSKTDASKLMIEFKKMKLNPNALRGYEAIIFNLVSHWELKNLTKIVQHPTVKINFIKKQNNAL